jgi:hypothetical protein
MALATQKAIADGTAVHTFEEFPGDLYRERQTF